MTISSDPGAAAVRVPAVRVLLLRMFKAAIAAAQPALCIPPHLPAAPKGRLIVIGAGKASAAMAQDSKVDNELNDATQVMHELSGPQSTAGG